MKKIEGGYDSTNEPWHSPSAEDLLEAYKEMVPGDDDPPDGEESMFLTNNP